MDLSRTCNIHQEENIDSSVFRKPTSAWYTTWFCTISPNYFILFYVFIIIYHIVILYPLTSFSDRLLYHYAMFCFCKYIYYTGPRLRYQLFISTNFRCPKLSIQLGPGTMLIVESIKLYFIVFLSLIKYYSVLVSMSGWLVVGGGWYTGAGNYRYTSVFWRWPCQYLCKYVMYSVVL